MGSEEREEIVINEKKRVENYFFDLMTKIMSLINLKSEWRSCGHLKWKEEQN
jgi:hypothetical protein